MRPCGCARHGNASRGFTVIELLIAMAIVMSIAAVLAQVVEPGRAAFERVPAELDLQQRGRTAIDVLTRAVRSAGADVAATGGLGAFAAVVPAVALSDPDETGEGFTTLTVLAPVANAAQGILESDHQGGPAQLMLAPAACPNVQEVCGFSVGMTAVITDGAGHHDIFVVHSTSAGSRSVTADRGFAHSYPAGSAVVEIDQHKYALALQGDASFSLLRETAAGAGQPVVDHVTALSFRSDANAVAVSVTVRATTEPLRRVIADRVFSTAIKWRNGS